MLKEKDVMKVPAEVMPLEQCALLREHLTAYRLLEDHSLKVGELRCTRHFRCSWMSEGRQGGEGARGAGSGHGPC